MATEMIDVLNMSVEDHARKQVQIIDILYKTRYPTHLE